MIISRLANHFIEHSPKFGDDLKELVVDSKHIEVVSKSISNIQNLTIENFRNWEGQSDLEIPAAINLFNQSPSKLPKAIAKYIYRKAFRRQEDRSIALSLRDDIAVIESIGGSNLLRENPVDLTPGKTSFSKIKGYKVNPRWLRYIYLTQRMRNERLLNPDTIWVDIGSYYGGLQGLVRKYEPNLRMVMVDFHHQLCRSYVYLSLLYPNAKHILPDEINHSYNLENLPKGSILYCPALEFERICNSKADLVTNFFSFGEMRPETFQSYYSSKLITNAVNLYLVNRFVSSPFFEKTYDTDLSILDYMTRESRVEYFDVFPIHHFMAFERELFGVNGLRNTSSAYFEMLFKL